MPVGTGVVVGLVLLGLTSGFGLLTRVGLLLAAAMVTAALMGGQRRGRRGECIRLTTEYGLSSEEAHSAIRLVESGRASTSVRLRLAAHDYAQRQLDTNPTPGWVVARGVAVVFGGYFIYAVIHPYPPGYLAPTLILTAGAACYHFHTRPERMREALHKTEPR